MGKGKGNFKNPITNTRNSLPLNEHKQFYYQIDGERDRAPVSGGAKEEYNISPSLPKRGIFGDPSGRVSFVFCIPDMKNLKYKGQKRQ
jgi:hypothetical protein